MKAKNKISEFLDIPRELDVKESKITIISFDQVFIENYKGILEYGEFFVKIATAMGTININRF